MLKKSALKKIIISSLALIIVSILYIFPNSYQKNTIVEEISLNDVTKSIIYIPDKNSYVSRTNVITKEKNIIDKVKEIIEYLTINSDKKDYIPIFFTQIIPQNTKILDIELNDKILKIDFSKEFFNVQKGLERNLIESIVFSLTEFKEIDKIMIFVDGELLKRIPNTNEVLPTSLDRSIGINIVYDINDYRKTNLVTTYYLSKENNYYYYVPVSTITNNESEKVEVIIEELKNMPIYQTNLMSFLKSNVKLLDYEILEDQISLSFNNFLLEDITSKKILEEVKYSISLSVKDTYNINTVSYNVDNEEVLKFTLN